MNVVHKLCEYIQVNNYQTKNNKIIFLTLNRTQSKEQDIPFSCNILTLKQAILEFIPASKEISTAQNNVQKLLFQNGILDVLFRF